LPYPEDEPGFSGTSYPLEPFDASFVVPAPPRKFRNRLWWHVALFLLTAVTTTITGALHYGSFVSAVDTVAEPAHWWQLPEYYFLVVRSFRDSGLLWRGFWYSGTLLGILGAHEMGHYLLCRRHNIDASLPYFLPMPPFVFLTGTLGAVIRIREPFPTRRVLFDIGVAGPIAGFVVLVPALFYGMTLSNVVPYHAEGMTIFLGEPLLFKLAANATFSAVADGYALNMHPMVFAAWFGMLATALNLLPFGQLDGGHITYAALRRWATPVSIATVSVAVMMTAFVSVSWLVITAMMLAMIFTLGPRHPRVIDEDEPLGTGRNLVAILALIIFILSFTPVPIEIQDLIGK
jgi:membrane-associated protease RseP (regulator of RpoE activity)